MEFISLAMPEKEPKMPPPLRLITWACAFGLCFFPLMGRGQMNLNVTNFGAFGDLMPLQSASTVSNSSSITCPDAHFVDRDRRKLIEVFGGGAWCGVSNQTLIAYITNVLSPTSVMVSQPAGATASGLSGCYGTDDAIGFSNAIANAPYPTATIIIPAGNYLLAPRAAITGYGSSLCHQCAVYVTRGGLTFAGQGNVILTQTGWEVSQAGGPEGERGAMFGFISPMANDYPVVFTNLTFYGGEAQGWIHNLDFPASASTGLGWDESHHALAFYYGNAGGFVDSLQVENCAFQGWRGEVLITTYSPSNTFMTVSNCVFSDNNATAVNIDFAHLWISDLFSNLNQVEEFYRDYATMPSMMTGCVITNAGVVALNGGYYNDPPYTINDNQFYGSGFTLYTTPACDVNFISNYVAEAQGAGIGAAGYQDSTYNTCNSNILIAWNTFNGCQYAFGVLGNGNNMAEDVYFASNTVENAWGIGGGYGYSTNVYAFNNQCTNVGWFNEWELSGQWFLDQSNNYNCNTLNNSGTVTNLFSYDDGRLGTIQAAGWGSVMALDDTHPARVPAGATMVISNVSAQSFPLYPSASLSGTPVTLPGGATLSFHWTGKAWTTNNIKIQFTNSSSEGVLRLKVDFRAPSKDSDGNTLSHWLWNFGDGTTGAGQNATHSYTNLGTFFPVLTAKNALGIPLAATGSGIAVTNPIIKFPDSPSNACLLLKVQFKGPDADSGGNKITSWQWNFGDGTTSTLRNPAHAYASIGTYQPSLNVVNKYGLTLSCEGPAVNVNYPTVQFSASPTNGVSRLKVQFKSPSADSLGVAIKKWAWSFGDGSSGTERNPLHIYTNVGTFYPLLKVSNALGLVETNMGITITVGGGEAAVAKFSPAVVYGSPPRLSLSLSGTNVILTWPTNTVSYSLQCTTDCANWNTIVCTPVVANGRDIVTKPACGHLMFFRLKQ